MRLLSVVLLCLVLTACGPDPKVLSVHADDPQDGKSVVTVEVENRGGDGTVDVRITLRDDAGNVVGRDTQSVELGGKEKVRIAIEVPVANGVTHVRGEAEATYPQE